MTSVCLGGLPKQRRARAAAGGGSTPTDAPLPSVNAVVPAPAVLLPARLSWDKMSARSSGGLLGLNCAVDGGRCGGGRSTDGSRTMISAIASAKYAIGR